MYSIKKKFKFEAAHRLQNTSSVCKNLHGHSYKVFVEIYSEKLNNECMIIDFGDLKLFQQFLDKKFDHSILIAQTDDELISCAKQLKSKYLILPYTNTTAENIAEYLYKSFSQIFNQIKCFSITVFETGKNSAKFHGSVSNTFCNKSFS